MEDVDEETAPSGREHLRRASSSLKSPELRQSLNGRSALRLRGRSSQKPAELFRKDLISAMKVPDSEHLPLEDIIIINDPWKQEWEAGVQVPVNPDFDSCPKVVKVTNLNDNNVRFVRSKKYIHQTKDETYDEKEHKLSNYDKIGESLCRYDLDLMDISWLEIFNRGRTSSGIETLGARQMERIIECFEDKCHENMQMREKTGAGLGIEYDENVVCDVCRSPDAEDNNEIVFCDGCDVCVHQGCYGIQRIPDGPYYCRPCALGVKKECVLCPNTGGALKSTRSGLQWAHLSCAIWIPEIAIENTSDLMEPIKHIQSIPQSRRNLACCICKRKKGACIQCSIKSCVKAYHVTCAQRSGLTMNCTPSSKGTINYLSYCPKHSKNKSDLTTDNDDDDDVTIDFCQENRNTKIERLKEEFYTLVNAADVACTLKEKVEIVENVHVYWTLKRKSFFDKPLLHPKTDDSLTEAENDLLNRRLAMFIKLRQNLERVRNLCYLVTRREKHSKKLANVKKLIIHKQAEMLENTSLTSREKPQVIRAHRVAPIYDDHDSVKARTAILESDAFQQRYGYHDSQIITNKVNKNGVVIEQHERKSFSDDKRPFRTLKIPDSATTPKFKPNSKKQIVKNETELTDKTSKVNDLKQKRGRSSKIISEVERKAKKLKFGAQKLLKKRKPTVFQRLSQRNQVKSKVKLEAGDSCYNENENSSNSVSALKTINETRTLRIKLAKTPSESGKKSEKVVKSVNKEDESKTSDNALRPKSVSLDQRSTTDSLSSKNLRSRSTDRPSLINRVPFKGRKRGYAPPESDYNSRLTNYDGYKKPRICEKEAKERLSDEDENRRSERLRCKSPPSPYCAHSASTPQKKSTTLVEGSRAPITSFSTQLNETSSKMKAKLNELNNVPQRKKKIIRCLRSRLS
ncbi:DgyrCDS9022 [Dimorphilus gyrociliatus]|uniref:DgyrCDS9022 n=1 Tax=Dimorphilus gyrociliatus TaxID=2664684 RepID=A0A7I8VY81_9ANNE|nr:DgyrCDS9022 [Dimorphilus gyrociliatus]